MKKSSKAMRVFVSLFLSCVSSFPFSSVAMDPKSTPELMACIIDNNKQPLKDAMKFYFTLVKAQQYFKIDDLKSIGETLYSGFMFNYLYFHLLHLNFQKVAEKFRDPNSELLYQRTLSYLVYSYKKLEYFDHTLETASAKYDPYGFEKATMNSLKELISGLSETLKKVISNENIINYTNQIIEAYNNNLNKNWRLLCAGTK